MSAAPTQPLPLLEAILQWSDPMLVDAVKAQERRFTIFQLVKISRRPRLSLEADLNEATSNGWMAGPPDPAQLMDAWENLERSFKARLTRQELFVYGVPTSPVRGTTRVALPGLWAGDFRFDLANSTIRIGDDYFIGVVASGEPPPPASAALRLEGPDATVEEVFAEVAPTLIANNAARSRGRASYIPVIRQSVIDNWSLVEANAQRQHDGQPCWSELARALHKRMQAAARRGLLGDVPQVDTIRTRLPEIYAAVLSEKPLQN